MDSVETITRTAERIAPWGNLGGSVGFLKTCLSTIKLAPPHHVLTLDQLTEWLLARELVEERIVLFNRRRYDVSPSKGDIILCSLNTVPMRLGKPLNWHIAGILLGTGKVVGWDCKLPYYFHRYPGLVISRLVWLDG